ncbi:MAG: hybrid sensor histidine kinase/response regulator [Planctomycetota bacterium]
MLFKRHGVGARGTRQRSPSIRGFLLRAVLGMGVGAAALGLLLDFMVLPRWLRASGLAALVRDDLVGTFVRQAWIHDACLLLFVVSVVTWVSLRIGRRFSEGFTRASRSLGGADSLGRQSEKPPADWSELRELLEAARRLGHELDLMRQELEEERARTRRLVDEKTDGLRQALRRLADKDRSRDRFVERVSHEFRTPLASIRSFAEILRHYGQSEDPATVEEFLAIIQRESDRLSRLIADFLDLSNIERGRVTWRLAPVDIGWVVRECAQACRGVCEAKRLQLEVDPGVGVPRVRADHDRVAQVVTNLLSHAISVTPEGGRLRASVTKETGELVAVAVDDSGGTLDAEQRALLTRGGEVALEATSLADHRLSLGLAIVREIVEALGGSVRIEDSELGGSRIVFTCHAWVQADGALPREGRPPTVLVVAECPVSRLALRQALAPAGFLTAEVAPEEAELRARLTAPDLVVVDLVSESVSSWQALREFRADPELKHVPVLLVALQATESGSARHAVEAFVPEAQRGGELLRAVQAVEERLERSFDRVLVVSNAAAARQVIASVLRHSGRDACELDGGSRAVSEIDKGADLVVVDMELTVRRVAELLRAARASRPVASVILITTHGDPASAGAVWPVMATSGVWPTHPVAARAAASLTALIDAGADSAHTPQEASLEPSAV